MPDQPLPQNQSMVDSLLNNDVVPADIKAKYWQIFRLPEVRPFRSIVQRSVRGPRSHNES